MNESKLTQSRFAQPARRSGEATQRCVWAASPQRVWAELREAHSFNTALDLYHTVEQNENFYLGRQWEGVNAPDLDKPVLNILRRVVTYQEANLVSDDIAVHVTDPAAPDAESPLCAMLEKQFDAVMEQCEFKRKNRDVVRSASVDGDACMHFFWRADPAQDTALHAAHGPCAQKENALRCASAPNPVAPEEYAPDAAPNACAQNSFAPAGHICAEMLDNTCVHFGNPQLCEVQAQPYVLLEFRRAVAEVRAAARAAGQDDASIVADEAERSPEAPERGKATVVRRYWKERGRVWMCEATRGALVTPPVCTGLLRYPLAWMCWEKVKNCFHGQAALTGLVPNQIFINKLFAMSMQHVKMMAFPTIVYNASLVRDGWNNRVGAAIPVQGDPNLAVATSFKAQDMSAQVLQLIDKVIGYTRDTMGASDVALGNTDTRNASAVLAVQKATVLPLELQRMDYYAFVEDSVRIWLDMMTRYYGVRAVRFEAAAQSGPGAPEALRALPGVYGLAGEQGGAARALFDFSALENAGLRLSVEIGEAAYWSELAQVQALDGLFASGALTDAATYLENLPDGYLPGRRKLVAALRARGRGEARLAAGERAACRRRRAGAARACGACTRALNAARCGAREQRRRASGRKSARRNA